MKPTTRFLSLLALASSIHAPLVRAANIWDGGGANGNWGTVENWDDDALPVFANGLIFSGATGLVSNNDQTGLTVNGIIFDGVADAFQLTGNSILLAGNVTNDSTAAQSIGLPMELTAARTVSTVGGNISISGPISGSFGLTKAGSETLTVSGGNTYTGTTTINSGTVKLGANNALPEMTNTTVDNIKLATNSGFSNTLDLAGFSLKVGRISSGSTTDSAGSITSSSTGAVLTTNMGTNSGNFFAGTRITGNLALTVIANNVASNGSGNLQMLNPNNNFNGGIRLQGAGSGNFTTANLALGGAFQSMSTSGLRTNAAAALGSGTITLDHGQLFIISSMNLSNNIAVTGRGGILHMEGTTGTANGGFTGAITSSTPTLLAINSNSGNNNIVKLSGDLSGFSGTLALDTSNIGGIRLSGGALGHSNINLLWSGASATVFGTGRVQAGDAASATYTFGELNNLNSGTTHKGFIENAISSTTATFSLGNSNTTPATFLGVIRNGTGTVALTKTGSNKQILAGSNTYTGATTIEGGVLQVTGSLAGGSAVEVKSQGTLLVDGSVGGAINVDAGGTIGGTGSIGGTLNLFAGSGAGNQATVNLVNGAVGTLSLTNAATTFLGNGAGEYVNLQMEVGPSSADQISLTGDLDVGDGGAVISIQSLGVAANQTYELITFTNGTGTGFVTGTGTTVGALSLANPSLGFGVSGVLNVTATGVQLVTSGSTAPSSAYWSGSKGSTWVSNSGGEGNFTTTASGSTFTNALPGSNTDVFFSNNSASNFSHTLGANFAVKSLTFLGSSAAINLGGLNQLSLQEGGITVQSGNAGATLEMSSLVLGLDQTWTNNSSNPLVITSTVTGATSALTMAGQTITLGGASLTCAALTMNQANLNLNGTDIVCQDLQGTSGIQNAGDPLTITSSQTNDTSYSGAISDTDAAHAISLVKSGSGSLTLSGDNFYSGSTVISAGTLKIAHANALGASGLVSSGLGTTVSNGATLDLNGQELIESLLVTGAGAGGIGALINSNVTTPAYVNTDILNSTSFTVGGVGDITIDRVQSSSLQTITKIGTGTLTLGGSSLAHNNFMALKVDEGKVILNMPGFLSVDRGLSINNSAVVQLAGASTNTGQLQDDQTVTINGGTFDLHGQNETIGALNGGSGTSVTNTAASTMSVLTLGGTSSNNGTFSGVIGDGAGSISITKSGTGTQTLNGAQTYSGTTRINAGVLSINTAYLADTADVYIAAAGQLQLNFTGSDTVAALYIAGQQMAPGTYGATGSGATNIDDTRFSGTGTLTVTGSLPGFASWISGTFAGGTLAIADQEPTDDPDNDGLNNLLEYAVAGMDPTVANGSVGTLSGLTVTFQKRALAVSNADVLFDIEQSEDLGVNDAWSEVTPTTDSASEISYTFPGTSAKDFARLKITKP